MHIYLEILISMAGLYIIFSIVTSGVLEILLRNRNSRGKFLRHKIQHFFEPESTEKHKPNNAFQYFKEIIGLFIAPKGVYKEDNIGNIIYDKPLIKAYKKGDKDPEHIDKNVFSSSLMEILFPPSENNGKHHIDLSSLAKLPGHIEESVKFIVQKAEENGEKKLEYIQQEIEKLYDAFMNEVSHWYKTNVKKALTLFGFMFALIFNLDTFHIYDGLKTDSSLRKEQVAMSTFVYDNKDKLTLDSVQLNKILEEAEINKVDKDSLRQNILGALQINGKEVLSKDSMETLDIGFLRLFHNNKSNPWKLIASIFGCWLTSLALAQGSSFWFKILKRLLGR